MTGMYQCRDIVTLCFRDDSSRGPGVPENSYKDTSFQDVLSPHLSKCATNPEWHILILLLEFNFFISQQRTLECHTGSVAHLLVPYRVGGALIRMMHIWHCTKKYIFMSVAHCISALPGQRHTS